MATIEIDGKTIEAENGKMIIEVADEAGIHIPRFCYHKKLSVAANCRMCLVEIENSKKTVPACATSISQGMKVFTKSAAALKSQQAVMEFLLINHPLDCPICDQGGECELQDVSMGFGKDHGDYEDTKRSVDDKSLGSLISTHMTRCIHCTRCVRFGEEIAGLRELGAPYRGENMQIGTYVESSMRSEVSGNIIDLCPVGALTSKPYRFTARSWEMTQNPGIAAHDCLGSNVYIHTRLGKVMRVIPKDAECINETWLSDRDRFSYTGLHHKNRLSQPMVKQDGQWKALDWSTALNLVTTKLGEVLAKHGPESVAAFASTSSTNEEFYILQKWLRAIDVENIDCRSRQNDFSGEGHFNIDVKNSLNYKELENQSAVFIIGSHVQREVPLAATRLRKAYLNGATIASLHATEYDYPFALSEQIVADPFDWEAHLLAIMSEIDFSKVKLPKALKDLQTLKVTSAHKEIAKMLSAENAVILTGHLFENHPRYAVLRLCLEFIHQNSSIKWIHLSQGANTKGASLAGFVPKNKGLTIADALKSNLKAVLLHGLEPSYDFADVSAIRTTLLKADFVVAVTAFETDDLKKHADILLPMASFTETSGTFVNLDGTWQTFEGAATPYNEARPAWKIYRVLANLSDCKGFDYSSSEEILQEMKSQVVESFNTDFEINIPIVERGHLLCISHVPLYAIDMLTRHAIPLQQSAAVDEIVIKMNSKLADKFQIGSKAVVYQDDNKITLPVEIDNKMYENVLSIPASLIETQVLGSGFTWVGLEA